MDNAYVEAIHLWLQHNTLWLGPVIALVACLESLVVVGIILPGVAMLFTLAAIAGAASMSFYPVLLWAFAGAVIGDGLSFLVGYHYHERLRRVWPFSHHPKWLEQGEKFFQRYGMLSVVIGRFVGPVRPVIPAVAGMLGMPAGYFLIVNILSAIAWAPAYLLPGYLTGAALQWYEGQLLPDQLLHFVLALAVAAIALPPLFIFIHQRCKPKLISYPLLALGLLMFCLLADILGWLNGVNQSLLGGVIPLQLQRVMTWLALLGSWPALAGLFVGCLVWLYRCGRIHCVFVLLWGAALMVGSLWFIAWLTPLNIAPAIASTAFILFYCAFMLAERRSFEVQWGWASLALALIFSEVFAQLLLKVNGIGEALVGVSFGLFFALTLVWQQRRS